MEAALVAGATGSVGTPIVNALVARGRPVVAVARRIDSDPRPEVTAVAVDINDRDALRAALADHRITEVYYAVKRRPLQAMWKPRDPQSTRRKLRRASQILRALRWLPGLERTAQHAIAKAANAAGADAENLQMLRNLIEATEMAPHGLRHLVVVTGTMHYGMHLGPDLYRGHEVPYDDRRTPRCPGGCWYHTVEDWLTETEKSFSWTVLRPTIVISQAIRPSSDYGTTLAIWASLCKARGEPAVFPGDREAQDMRQDLTPGPLVAEMALWSARTPAAAGQSFNCACGQRLPLRDIFTELACSVGVEPAFSASGLRLGPRFADAQATWDRHVERHGLVPLDLSRGCTPHSVDTTHIMYWDVELTMDKARDAGFTDIPDLRSVMPDLVQRLRTRQFLPT